MPVLLDKYPPYYQPKITHRKPPAERSDLGPAAKKEKKDILDTQDTRTIPDSIPENHHTDIQDTDQIEEVQPANNSDSEISRSTSETWSCCLVTKLQLPINWVCCNTLNEKEKFVAHIDPKTRVTDKTINFIGTNLPEIEVRGVPITFVNLPPKICSIKDAEKIVNKVDLIRVCAGTGIVRKPYSEGCEGGVMSKHQVRCKFCAAEKERQRKIEQRRDKAEERKERKKIKMKNTVRSLKRSKLNLLEKVRKYKVRLQNMQAECEKKNEDVLQSAISKLPPAQQEAVKACFNASKRKGPSGNRYTAQWVYECLLMRNKDKKLYNHIRVHQILALPTLSTINGYLRNYGGCFGFQPQTLQMLAEKTADLKTRQRRGQDVKKRKNK
ncbi:uncharacterized protein LOC127749500 [Frankliniella occidentalis]|uniref:Uncharacterized protein LOC127749500 n=1 Tax=Frankliniella occidentalis TaxID=133901 RepID=A0A9C6U631_FRAOC|nr:uncharacterized protein LOC127749500 [Frankliniella occidentalis]